MFTIAAGIIIAVLALIAAPTVFSLLAGAVRASGFWIMFFVVVVTATYLVGS